ncbi:uncharacterized protein LOC126455601 [Schistocerca serialis cubense]|uniref:uncharacterized protein LOC126455601 n=1 Tax=Schistocerca serialis cubense TaxID=2023355 RepID=UPI00214E0CC5|nr:uncharacterized protein LOC126455601 [Schistocerca serialis cubense]
MKRLLSFLTLLFVACQMCTTQQAVVTATDQSGRVSGVHPLSGDVSPYAREQMGPRLDTCQQDFVQPVADFILRVFRSQTIKRGKQQVKIPDVHKTKFKGVGPIGFTVRFDATEGWLRDLSSLRRVGNVSISRYGNNVVMEFGAGLQKMEFGYDKYDLKAGPFSAKGHISGEVFNSSVTVRVSMDVGGETCSLVLLDVKISIPGEIKMQATGMGMLNMFYSQIMSSVTKKLEEGLPKAEASLSRSIQEVFQKLRCDDEHGLI